MFLDFSKRINAWCLAFSAGSFILLRSSIELRGGYCTFCGECAIIYLVPQTWYLHRQMQLRDTPRNLLADEARVYFLFD